MAEQARIARETARLTSAKGLLAARPPKPTGQVLAIPPGGIAFGTRRAGRRKRKQTRKSKRRYGASSNAKGK